MYFFVLIVCDLIVIICSEWNVVANYKPDLSCQGEFIPINFSQQIISGTFEFALSHIVDNHLDLTTFDNASKEWSDTFAELARKQKRWRQASIRIIEHHQAQDGLSEDEVVHDLKQKEKLDKSADKIRDFLATNKKN